MIFFKGVEKDEEEGWLATIGCRAPGIFRGCT